MSVLIELYIVIVIIYLFECIILADETTALLYSSWFSFKMSYKEGVYKWSNKFVKFLNPFIPQMDVFKADFPGYSISPIGICSIRVNELRAQDDLPTRKTFYKFDEINRISLEDNVILINGDLTIKCSSSYEAAQIKKLLNEVSSSQSENIEQIVIDHLEGSFELKLLTDKMNSYEKKSFILKNIVLVYWIFLFLILPVLLFNFGFYLVFEKILFILAALHILTIGSLVLTYRSVYGKVYSSDFKSSLIKIMLSPLAACRSMNIISEEYLRQFHPIVIMQYLLPEGLFKLWGNKIIREYRYLNAYNGTSEVEAQILQWNRDKINAQIENFITEQNYTPDDLLKPIISMSKNTLSYCPRCLTEYSIEAGQCSDCDGINLIALKETGQTT